MKTLINRCLKEGIIFVFTSSFLDKVVKYCSMIVLARILSKNDYGVYSYAFNIITLFMLLTSGLSAATLQFCSETGNNDVQSAYFFLGIKYGAVINFIGICLIGLIAFNNLLPIVEANQFFLTLIFIPIVTFGYNCCISLLRAKILNKHYSITILFSSVIIFLFSIIGAYFFGLYGTAYFQNIAYLLTLILAFFIAKKYFYLQTDIVLTKRDKRNFINYSWAAFFATSIGQLLYLIDVFLIGWLLKQAYPVAIYKIATIIPFGLMFLPLAVMTFIYPYFARHKDDKNWLIKHATIVLIFMFVLNSILVIPMLVFTSKAILMFFGNKYAGNSTLISVFRVLLVGYLVAGTLRVPIGNILSMMRKINFNLITSVVSGVVNFVLAYVLINKYGIIGAAYSTLFVFCFSSLMITVFFIKTLVTK